MIKSTSDKQWMQHALNLSLYAEGKTAPNPMVGAVLVYEGRMIGQGWHQMYGTAHAEVNCIRSVSAADRHLIPESIMYVSLEPCNHFGKTPPCADLLVASKVKKVVIACKDPFPKVAGTGIEKLKNAGIEVVLGIHQRAAERLNRRFFTFHRYRRPYVTLKWASTGDGKMGSGTQERLMISHEYANRWVHRLRSHNQAILVGSNTVNMDNPLLDTRYAADRNPPVKIVLDRDGIVHPDAAMFHTGRECIVFTKNGGTGLKEKENVTIIEGVHTISGVLETLYNRNIQSVMVEGGRQVLSAFMEAGMWDEAFRIQGTTTFEGPGIPEPVLNDSLLKAGFMMGQDHIAHFVNKNNDYYL